MIVEVIVAALAITALLNLWVSWRVTRDDLSTVLQRAAHIVTIWALPVLGALLVLHFQRENPERSPGRYRDVPDAGDDYGASSRSYPRHEPQLRTGHPMDRQTSQTIAAPNCTLQRTSALMIAFPHIARQQALALLLVPILCGAADTSKSPRYVVEEAIVLNAVPGTAREDRARASLGAVVRVLERQAAWARVEDSGIIGWIPTSALVSTERFRRVLRWDGPRRADAGDGDYDAYYRFKRDGSFEVRETAGTEAPYRLVKRTGTLYRHGRLIWARIPGEPAYASRIFILAANGEFCWQGHMDGRCRDER